MILETAVGREKDVQELVQTFVIQLRFLGLFTADLMLVMTAAIISRDNTHIH